MTDQSPQMKMKLTKGISFYLLSWLFLVFLNHSVCSAEPKARPIKVTINGKTFPVIVATGTDGTSQVLRYPDGTTNIDIRGIDESVVKKIIELSKSSGILVTRSDGPNGVFSSAFEHKITITISNPNKGEPPKDPEVVIGVGSTSVYRPLFSKGNDKEYSTLEETVPLDKVLAYDSKVADSLLRAITWRGFVIPVTVIEKIKQEGKSVARVVLTADLAGSTGELDILQIPQGSLQFTQSAQHSLPLPQSVIDDIRKYKIANAQRGVDNSATLSAVRDIAINTTANEEELRQALLGVSRALAERQREISRFQSELGIWLRRPPKEQPENKEEHDWKLMLVGSESTDNFLNAFPNRSIEELDILFQTLLEPPDLQNDKTVKLAETKLTSAISIFFDANESLKSGIPPEIAGYRWKLIQYLKHPKTNRFAKELLTQTPPSSVYDHLELFELFKSSDSLLRSSVIAIFRELPPLPRLPQYESMERYLLEQMTSPEGLGVPIKNWSGHPVYQSRIKPASDLLAKLPLSDQTLTKLVDALFHNRPEISNPATTVLTSDSVTLNKTVISHLVTKWPTNDGYLSAVEPLIRKYWERLTEAQKQEFQTHPSAITNFVQQCTSSPPTDSNPESGPG